VVREHEHAVDDLIDVGGAELAVPLRNRAAAARLLDAPDTVPIDTSILLDARGQGAFAQVIQTVQDTGEWVIDFMSDAGGQFSDGCQLLGTNPAPASWCRLCRGRCQARPEFLLGAAAET
jgi:hypothetical protein